MSDNDDEVRRIIEDAFSGAELSGDEMFIGNDEGIVTISLPDAKVCYLLPIEQAVDTAMCLLDAIGSAIMASSDPLAGLRLFKGHKQHHERHDGPHWCGHG